MASRDDRGLNVPGKSTDQNISRDPGTAVWSRPKRTRNPDVISNKSDVSMLSMESYLPSGSVATTLKSEVDKDHILSVTTTFSVGASSKMMLAAKAQAAAAAPAPEKRKATERDAGASRVSKIKEKPPISTSTSRTKPPASTSIPLATLKKKSSLSTKLRGSSHKEVRRIRFSDEDVAQASKRSSTKPGAGREKQSPSTGSRKRSSQPTKQVTVKKVPRGKTSDKYRPGVLKQSPETKTEKQKSPRPSKGRDSKVTREEEETKTKPAVVDDDDEETSDTEDPTQIKKKRVTVQVIFYKFRDVNTSAETFDAEIILNARWRVPEFNTSKKLPDRLMDEGEYEWSPELTIENSIRFMKVMSQSMTLQYDSSGRAFVAQSTKYFGKFSETMELQDFPFDIQSMSLLIRTEKPLSEVRLTFSPEAPHLIRKSLYFQEQQFHLYMHAVSYDLSTDPYDEYGSAKTSDELRVSCLMARNPVFYINNCYLIALMLSLLGFVSFAPDVQFTMQRNVLSSFLTLAAFSHKYTLIPHIPKTSYMTHADRYCLAVIIFLLLVSVWQAIMTLVDVNQRKTLDTYGVAIFGGMFLLFNIVTWTAILSRTVKTRKKLDENEKDYIAKLKILRDEKAAIDDEILE